LVASLHLEVAMHSPCEKKKKKKVELIMVTFSMTSFCEN
jgi:hypothetical protein